MVWAIGLPTSNKRSLTPRHSIQYALFSSYAVFGLILLSIAGIVYVLLGHVYSLRLQEQALILSHLGEDAVEDVGRASQIRPALVRYLTSPDEGLEFFDARGRRIVALGLMEHLPAGPLNKARTRLPDGATGIQAITPVKDPPGWVRSTISDSRIAAALRPLDVGLAAGVVIALVVAVFAGSLLANQAVSRIEYTLDRMREFTADAAHELRGPLMAIMNNVEELSSHEERGNDRYLSNIRLAAGQMVAMMNDLLLLARSEEPGHIVVYAVDLSDCVERLVRSFEGEANGRNISVNVQRGTEHQTIYGNPDQIYRILENLLRNAFRYTADGGSIEIKQLAAHHFMIVAVTDTGIGIAPDALEKIFERFWRADAARNTPGSGLGLAIARNLARRHGGDIYVDSVPGRGSTFSLQLPYRPPSRPIL
jgi:two-component system, OmpR family, manganese sensing sensor histidine kinase